MSLEQPPPVPTEAVTGPAANSHPSEERISVGSDQQEGMPSPHALQKIAKQTVPPPSSLVAPRPDLEVISDLLAKFKNAFEARDMAALLRISEMSPDRGQILEEMFRTYPIIKISYSDLSLTHETATFTVVVYKLIDREGELVSPQGEWKRSRVMIKKEEERWGKLIW